MDHSLEITSKNRPNLYVSSMWEVCGEERIDLFVCLLYQSLLEGEFQRGYI